MLPCSTQQHRPSQDALLLKHADWRACLNAYRKQARFWRTAPRMHSSVTALATVSRAPDMDPAASTHIQAFHRSNFVVEIECTNKSFAGFCQKLGERLTKCLMKQSKCRACLSNTGHILWCPLESHSIASRKHSTHKALDLVLLQLPIHGHAAQTALNGPDNVQT